MVAVNSGFDKLIVEVKGPTSAPPEPLNVKVPPVWGMAPAGNCEKKVPLMPNWEANVIATPDGSVRVKVPASSPVTVGIGTGLILWTTTHPPGESDVLGAYRPV